MWHNAITNEFIERFSKFDNTKACVRIQHALYGTQKANGILIQTLLDEERVGIIIDGEEKYIYLDEIVDIGIKDNECHIKSDVMEISLQL